MNMTIYVDSSTPGSQLRLIAGALLVMAGDFPAAVTPAALATAADAPATAKDPKASKPAKAAAAKEPAAEAAKVEPEVKAEPAAAAAPEVPEVTVEQVRAVASQFSTDDTRPHALAILQEYGLASVSASAALPAPKRAALLDALSGKLKELQAEALTA